MGTSLFLNSKKWVLIAFSLFTLIDVSFLGSRSCRALDLNLIRSEQISRTYSKDQKFVTWNDATFEDREGTWEEGFLVIPFRFLKFHFSHIGFRIDFSYHF